MNRQPSEDDGPGLHPDRAAGGDRDHRRPDRPAPARRPGRPRGRPAVAVRQQPDADRPRHQELRELPRGRSRRASINPTGPIVNKPTGYHLNWVSQILPFIDTRTSIDHLNFNVGVYGAENATVRGVSLQLAALPERRPVRPWSVGAGTERRDRRRPRRRVTSSYAGVPPRRRGADRRDEQRRLLPQQRASATRTSTTARRRRSSSASSLHRRPATSAGPRAPGPRSATWATRSTRRRPPSCRCRRCRRPRRRSFEVGCGRRRAAKADAEEGAAVAAKAEEKPADPVGGFSSMPRRRGQLRLRRRLGPLPQATARPRISAAGQPERRRDDQRRELLTGRSTENPTYRRSGLDMPSGRIPVRRRSMGLAVRRGQRASERRAGPSWGRVSSGPPGRTSPRSTLPVPGLLPGASGSFGPSPVTSGLSDASIIAESQPATGRAPEQCRRGESSFMAAEHPVAAVGGEVHLIIAGS